MSGSRKTPLYVKVDGIYCAEVLSPQCFQEALEYEPKPGDVFICTYPKCGTTWMQTVVLNIFRRGRKLDNFSEFLKYAPYIDMMGIEGINNMPRPGAFKTHLPYTHIPYSTEAKYVYVTRNPKDCCTSFYYHTKTLPGFGFWDGNFDDFFELFMAGEVEYGDYFDHLLSWYPHRNDPNVFHTTYEDMKKDMTSVVKRLARFLGEEYIDAIEKNDTILDNILLHSSFEYMRENLSDIYDMKEISNEKSNVIDCYSGLRYIKEFIAALNPPKDLPEPQVVRKGIVGDWKNNFSSEQNTRLNRKCLERLKDTEVLQWYPLKGWEGA